MLDLGEAIFDFSMEVHRRGLLGSLQNLIISFSRDWRCKIVVAQGKYQSLQVINYSNLKVLKLRWKRNPRSKFLMRYCWRFDFMHKFVLNSNTTDAVTVLGRSHSNSERGHWEKVKKVVRDLQHVMLTFSNNDHCDS